jgi:hypothetical protein
MKHPIQQGQVVLLLVAVAVVARAMPATNLGLATHAGLPSVGSDTYATN